LFGNVHPRFAQKRGKKKRKLQKKKMNPHGNDFGRQKSDFELTRKRLNSSDTDSWEEMGFGEEILRSNGKTIGGGGNEVKKKVLEAQNAFFGKMIRMRGGETIQRKGGGSKDYPGGWKEGD